MATCDGCGKTIVRGTRGDGAVIFLEPGYDTYASVEPQAIYPQDDDRVFLSASYVEHAPLCPAKRREWAQKREQRTKAEQQKRRSA